jgi:hypothetical protein
MQTVLFVHGTGTRDPAYSLMIRQIQESLAGHAVVEPCYWGSDLGSRLHAGGASIPAENTREGFSSWREVLEADSKDDYEIVLWELLLKDPFFELRLLGVAEGKSGGFSLRHVPATLNFERLSKWNSTLDPDDTLRSQISKAGLDDVLHEASDHVRNSTALSDAEASGDRQACRVAAARAILAAALLLLEEREQVTLARTSASLRDALVDGFARVLDELYRKEALSQRGFLNDNIRKPLLGLAVQAGKNMLTGVASRGRHRTVNSTSLIAGDILLYQARGEGIRHFIRQRVEACDGGVVLLAHSLGGVACIDLLMSENLPQVGLLVTLGSQGPFFYEIGALPSKSFENVSPDLRLPAHFPRWLNFYDLRDFLSFVGEPIFGPQRVRDIRIDSRLPFPDSHGGYFSNPNVWQTIVNAL